MARVKSGYSNLDKLRFSIYMRIFEINLFVSLKNGFLRESRLLFLK